jgi:hypothetical protein
MSDFEPVENKKLTKSEISLEIEKAKAINSNQSVLNKWNELIEWLISEIGVAQTILFISDSFTFDDFKTEIRLAID